MGLSNDCGLLSKKIKPMLAYSAKPFDSKSYLYEIKWDGTRCIMFVHGKKLRLQNRRLVDITYRYPELTGTHRDINARNTVLDGELVVFSEGRPDFSKLQQREQTPDKNRIRILSEKMPATYMVFDILYLNHEDLTHKPLSERKTMLRKILGDSAYLIESQYVTERGVSFFEDVIKQGLEGAMAKSLNSPYLIGKRSRYWLKFKPRFKTECAILGYMSGAGARKNLFGSLVIGQYVGKKMLYRGRVGSGFSDKDLHNIYSRLKELKIGSSPFPFKIKNVQWVKPELKCEVSYQELTHDGKFRAPVFHRVLD